MTTKSAAILIIGDEILSGRTLDTNTQSIAKALAARGIAIVEARVIPDVVEIIVDAVNTLRARVDYVFTTGGIGPTHDDRTAEAMAKAFGVPLERNAEAWARLVRHYEGVENITDARARMAMIPAGADLIDNPVSTAPGFKMGNVHVMAGVPKIMMGMLDGIVPHLAGGDVVHSRSVSADLPESLLAAGIEAIEKAYEGLSVGSYPRFQLGLAPAVTIVVRGTDERTCDAAIAKVAGLMQELGGTPVYL